MAMSKLQSKEDISLASPVLDGLSNNGSENSLVPFGTSNKGHHPSKKIRKKRSKAPPGKPPFSYVALIAMAISSSRRYKMTLAQINKFIADEFSYYANCPLKWRDSIRHSLSNNDCFVMVSREPNDEIVRGHYWTIDPASANMFEDGCFRRRRKIYKREKDVDEILPDLIERTNQPKVPAPPQRFQSIPFPTVATLPAQGEHSAVYTFPPMYRPTPIPIARKMISYLPTPYMMPAYYPAIWTPYPAHYSPPIYSKPW